MKKYLMVLMTVIMCFAFTSCDSENIKAAKEAMDNGEYETVIELLEKEEDLNDKGVELMEEAKANIAFNEKKYDEAIIHIVNVKIGKKTDLYEKSTNRLWNQSLKTGEGESLLDAANVDADFCKTVTEKIKSACDDMNGYAFKLLVTMKDGIKDKEVKKDLENYYEENKMNMPKAFLLGAWMWDEGSTTNTEISVVTYKKELMGSVLVVGDNEKEFQMKKDDIYWTDFEFTSETQFTCSTLCKTRDGIEVHCTSIGRIDYANNVIHFHLTAPEPYSMEVADRVFKKIK